MLGASFISLQVFIDQMSIESDLTRSNSGRGYIPVGRYGYGGLAPVLPPDPEEFHPIQEKVVAQTGATKVNDEITTES